MPQRAIVWLLVSNVGNNLSRSVKITEQDLAALLHRDPRRSNERTTQPEHESLWRSLNNHATAILRSTKKKKEEINQYNY